MVGAKHVHRTAQDFFRRNVFFAADVQVDGGELEENVLLARQGLVTLVQSEVIALLHLGLQQVVQHNADVRVLSCQLDDRRDGRAAAAFRQHFQVHDQAELLRDVPGLQGLR